MTLTRERMRRLAIAVIAVLALTSVLFGGNQRQVQAFDFFSIPISGGDIANTVFCILEQHPPADVFDIPGCGSNGGHISQCSDGVDNDGDGKIDYPADPGCASAEDDSEFNVAVVLPQCSDLIDNDGDGKIDWNPLPGLGDPDCATPLDDDESNGSTPPTPAQCADGLDNDGDGLIDLNDPGCADASDNDETNITNGGGSTPAQCADGLDNDGDGLIDLADPGCESATDNDETNSASSESQSSGGGGGGGGGHRSSGGLVLGATAESCSQYLTAFIRSGQANDLGQVARLQYVLKEFEGAPITINGIYDAATLSAVNAFQLKYTSDILTPWGISQPTGYVYLTTRKKINEVYCRGTMQFPLTQSEAQYVESVRTSVEAPSTPAPTSTFTPALTAPASVDAISPNNLPTGQVGLPAAVPAAEQQSGGWWGAVKDFFGWLF